MVKASSSGLSSDLAGGADTIVARATPAGRGALALIRVSGTRTRECAARVCRELSFADGWRVSLTTLRDAAGEVLDRGVVITYPGPRSYTGEDMLEICVHGSPYLVNAVTDSFIAAGARPAEPGEFTRRAVANGKLDLVQAEAVGDLIASDTAWQHRNAREQLAGALSDQFARLRASLITALGAVEASLDYEAQGVVVDPAETTASLEVCRSQIRALVATAQAGSRIRDGVRVAILGGPNAGKSTLFNHLCGSERAIVSPHPGTTRDVIEAELDIGGVRMVLQDTAGLRADGDEVEAEGHRRAEAAAAAADLAVILWAMDSDDEMAAPVVTEDLPVIRVRSKSDLDPEGGTEDGWLRLSSHTGEGMGAFRNELLQRTGHEITDLGGAVAIANRHRRALETALAELASCDADSPEKVAESLRWSVRAMDHLVGEVAVEDILDEVFSAFCIGK
jgi:tRNA modification GTPase